METLMHSNKISAKLLIESVSMVVPRNLSTLVASVSAVQPSYLEKVRTSYPMA